MLTLLQTAPSKGLPVLPLEIIGMIAKEADDEDLTTQRLVSKFWSSVTAERFALLFRQSAFEFTQAGLTDMLKVCQHSAFGPQIQTLIIITDCKRRNAAKFHDLYNQALQALKGYGQQVRLGVRWHPTDHGELVEPKIAAGRLGIVMQKRILPAARAAGLNDNDILFELPDANLVNAGYDSYRKLVEMVFDFWAAQARFGGHFNPNITISIGHSTTSPRQTPSMTFKRNPNIAERRNLTAAHIGSFWSLIVCSHPQELHLYNCTIEQKFFRFRIPTLQTLTMDKIEVYDGYVRAHSGPNRFIYGGCPKELLKDAHFKFPDLNRLELKNIRTTEYAWMKDNIHDFDVTGPLEIARALPYLLEGFRGWEIAYKCSDDPVAKARMLKHWQGKHMGSGYLEDDLMVSMFG